MPRRKIPKPPESDTPAPDAAAGRSAGDLGTYRAKRSAGATPEPFGGDAVERPGLFVVQQHAARRLHWDLRLEIGGALHSWAVPKGPSLDPADKRLAVETEDHPLEYADFEGVIPTGNYGAGSMIVWDRGRWVPHAEEKGGPKHGLEHGKLLFDLEGYKLRGLWTLVRTARDPKEWLLIKKPDAWATGADAEAMGGESVLSGLTVEELAAGGDRAAEVRAELERLGARRRRVRAETVKPMLAEVARAPFSRSGWLFELKYDGYRAIAGIEPAGVGSGGGGGTHSGRAHLFYRSGREATATWPDVARALAALPYDELVLDGEIAVLDEAARPSFQRLQRRGLLTRRTDVERAAVELPAAYFVFDLLGFEGFDLRPLPLVERKRLLRDLLPRAGPVRFADHVAERGEALYEEVRRAGVEGVVAKKADGRYRAGRSPDWLKVRAERTGDFAVVGFTEPKGSRTGFGALHLAAWEVNPEEGERQESGKEQEKEELGKANKGKAAGAGRGERGTGQAGVARRRDKALLAVGGDGEMASTGGGAAEEGAEEGGAEGGAKRRRGGAGGGSGGRLVYVGRAGSGFSDKQLGALHRKLKADEVAEPPCGPNAAGELPRGRDHHWVEPRLVAEVKFTEVTEAGQLRHPVFLRLRDDKRIEECTLEAAVPGAGGPPPGGGRAGGGAGDEPPAGEPAGGALDAPPREVEVSRPEKVFWPAPATDPPITKGELVAYYRAVAPWLLPYLRDRPVVLDRYPDGIGGKNFFQKNVPDFVPEWIRTETIWSEDRAEQGGGRETRYVVCDDLETLTWLINLGTIPLHLWSSRVGSLGTPDWSILDLDAKQATFGATVTVARAIRRLCQAIELDCFVKTSGATGMHVLLPLGGLFTHDQSRQLAELIARVIVAELPEVVTIVRSVADREGRVYLDYLQNGHGKLLVAPFSVRPRPDAPVSTPLGWREVGARLDPARHTLRTVPARLERMKRDPLRPVLEVKPDLTRALELLAARV